MSFQPITRSKNYAKYPDTTFKNKTSTTDVRAYNFYHQTSRVLFSRTQKVEAKLFINFFFWQKTYLVAPTSFASYYKVISGGSVFWLIMTRDDRPRLVAQL